MKSFREVERQFVILDTPKNVMLTGSKSEANSLLCYGYVDRTAGLTYQSVAATMYVDGDYTVVDTALTVSLKIRADSVEKDKIIPISNKALFKQYAYIVDNIDEFYYTNPEVEKCRAIKEFDQFRHADFPDDIQVMFFKEGVRPEGIWVRTTKLIGCDNGTFVLEGKMLNAPHADFGVTYGDTVVFGTGVIDEQGTRMCIALLQKE